jgi:hypothetical protein
MLDSFRYISDRLNGTWNTRPKREASFSPTSLELTFRLQHTIAKQHDFAATLVVVVNVVGYKEHAMPVNSSLHPLVVPQQANQECCIVSNAYAGQTSEMALPQRNKKNNRSKRSRGWHWQMEMRAHLQLPVRSHALLPPWCSCLWPLLPPSHLNDCPGWRQSQKSAMWLLLKWKWNRRFQASG